MKALIPALVLLAPAAAVAASPAPAPATAAARFTLDTPVETLVAVPAAKAVLDTDLPGLTTHPNYDMFKGMSLNQLVPFSPDKLTPERLAKVAADLAALK